MLSRQEYWLWFCNIEELNSPKREELLRIFGSPEAVFEAGEAELTQAGLTARQRNGIRKAGREESVKELSELLIKKGIRFISREEEEYPKRLRHIYHPPCGLFVRGRLPKEEAPAIGVVEARACSVYGREIAHYFAAELSKRGFSVISGLAAGIDAAAHTGALKAGGYTAAVLGCGTDQCYPQENLSLYLKLGETGGLLSEYPPGVPPYRANFPARNRIIAGLSDGIMVAEARERSGSLITASLALEEGKDIFSVPGRLGDALSEGCNRLIRAGAALVMTPEDIVQEYDRFFREKQTTHGGDEKFYNNLLETREKIVYANLSLTPKHIDALAKECKISFSELTQLLLCLELKGYARQVSANCYAACPDKLLSRG